MCPFVLRGAEGPRADTGGSLLGGSLSAPAEASAEGGGTVRTPGEARTVSSVNVGAVTVGTCSLVGTQLQLGRQRRLPLCLWASICREASSFLLVPSQAPCRPVLLECGHRMLRPWGFLTSVSRSGTKQAEKLELMYRSRSSQDTVGLVLKAGVGIRLNLNGSTRGAATKWLERKGRLQDAPESEPWSLESPRRMV